MLFDMPLHALDSCRRPGGLDLTARALELAKQIQPLAQGARMLDVGCGAGHTIRFLQEQGFEAYGIDTDTLTQPHACASATHLPFQDATFQAIVCECVLSVVPHAPTALKEFWRVSATDSSKALLLLSDVFSTNEASAKSQNLPEEPFTQKQLELYLRHAGWHIQHFEDHSHSLKAFAAQLAWHGLCLPKLGQGCYGYGLWIATKDAL